MINEVDAKSKISICKSAISASEEADAVLVLTEWPEYALIDWEKVSKKMIQPAWIFDSRSILDSEKVRKAKLNFWRVGDGA